MIIHSGTTWLAEKSQQLDSLTIENGASIAAPEGKYFILTVNGANYAAEPGEYKGDVRITVCDNFTRESLRFGEKTISDFRAAAIVSDNKLVENSSVTAMFQGGSVTGTEARDFTMESYEWDVNGFYITDDTQYTIENGEISMVGDGTDDFVGMGAAIAAAGKAKVTINNTKVHTEGIGRGTLFVGGEAEVTMNDCEFSTVSHVPSKEELEAGAKLERMMEPPWAIGLRGNGRTLNLAGSGCLNLNRCHVTSNSWGVLSVDGAHINRMNVKDSLIEITGSNGYGCFSIADDLMFDYSSFPEKGCIDVIDHSTFNVPYTGILMSLGNASGEFKNGSVVNSGRFGAFIHRNCGGYLKINSGSQFNTRQSSIIVKGANTSFELDDCVMKPENGTILQLMDNDDVGMCNDPFLIPVGEIDVRDDRDLTVAIPTEDVFMTVSNMETSGNFYNSTTNFRACNRREKPAPGMVPPEGMLLPDGMTPPPGENPNTMAPPMPEGAFTLRGFMGDDLMGAKNLDMKLINARVTGIISAATASYKEGLTRITKENCEELSNITQTAARPINNGVILFIDGASVWTVTGTSYLTKLELAEGGTIRGADGKAVTLFVDGVETPIRPGVYTGILELRVG